MNDIAMQGLGIKCGICMVVDKPATGGHAEKIRTRKRATTNGMVYVILPVIFTSHAWGAVTNGDRKSN